LRDAGKEALLGQLIDRDGTLWTASASGIHRVKDIAHLLGPHNAATASRDAFSTVDGLTAPYAQAFLEDRLGVVHRGVRPGQRRTYPQLAPDAASSAPYPLLNGAIQTRR